jgi:hypothetical protein
MDVKLVYMLILIWSATHFWNREPPYGNCFFAPIWLRESPYGNVYHMGIFSQIPIWARTLFWNGLVTEPSPYRNKYLFWYGNPHAGMGIHQLLIPIWKRSSSVPIWGCANPRFHTVIPILKRGSVCLQSPYRNRECPFWYGILKSPFPYGDPRFETGIIDFSLPIWERGVPVLIQGFFDPHFYTVIPVLKRGSMNFHSPYGNGECPFPYGDSSIPVCGKILVSWQKF